MELIKINSNNRPYYSDDFVKGFECGAKRQFEADKADIPTWIPCSERLPEENGKSYLTYQCGDDIRYGWCQVLRYDDGWNCLNGDKSNEIRRVVAWMPLPEPWEGADDETAND